MGYALFVKHISITLFRADGSIAERCCNFQHTQATAAVHLNVGLGSHSCHLNMKINVQLRENCLLSLLNPANFDQ